MAQANKSEVPEEVVAAARAAAKPGGEDAAALRRVDVAEATAEINYIETGSKEHERLLRAAYGGMTREMAETIIEERKKDPAIWPYERYQEAVQFLAVLDTEPYPVATKTHWIRDEV